MQDDKHRTEILERAASDRDARVKQLEGWSAQHARRKADELGIEWTDEHLAVVQFLQNQFVEHGMAESGRDLGDLLEQEFADRGGRKYLHGLFPGGPVTQGMQLAGLPVPPHSEDAGFGTAR